MFAWLKRFFGGRCRAKDTEALALKAQLHKRVDDLKEKAKKGDSDASLKLGALRESLTEQSIRLGKGAKAVAIALIAALALGVGGCSLADRKEILENVALVVETRAAAEVEKDLIKEGIDPAQAKKIAAIAIRKIDELVRKLIE